MTKFIYSKDRRLRVKIIHDAGSINITMRLEQYKNWFWGWGKIAFVIIQLQKFEKSERDGRWMMPHVFRLEPEGTQEVWDIDLFDLHKRGYQMIKEHEAKTQESKKNVEKAAQIINEL